MHSNGLEPILLPLHWPFRPSWFPWTSCSLGRPGHCGCNRLNTMGEQLFTNCSTSDKVFNVIIQCRCHDTLSMVNAQPDCAPPPVRRWPIRGLGESDAVCISTDSLRPPVQPPPPRLLQSPPLPPKPPPSSSGTTIR